MEPIDIHPALSRRRVLAIGAGAAVSVSALAGCGGSDDAASEPAGTTSTADSTSASAKASAAGDGAGALAKVADIPVGGAVSAQGPDGKPVIVSQPSDGKIVAFSAICTHMGCTVAPVGKILQCPCHGSTYDPATGTNTGGPAPRPLTEIKVRIEDGAVVEA